MFGSASQVPLRQKWHDAICGTDAYKHPLWNTELTRKLIDFFVGGFAQLDVPIMDPEKFKKASGILDSPVFFAKLDDCFKVWGRKDAAEMDMVRLMLWELKGSVGPFKARPITSLDCKRMTKSLGDILFGPKCKRYTAPWKDAGGVWQLPRNAEGVAFTCREPFKWWLIGSVHQWTTRHPSGTEVLEESLKELGKQYPIQALTGWEHVKECKRFLAKYLAYSRTRFGQEVDHYKGPYWKGHEPASQEDAPVQIIFPEPSGAACSPAPVDALSVRPAQHADDQQAKPDGESALRKRTLITQPATPELNPGIWTDQDLPVEENEDNAQDEDTDGSQETGSQSQNSRALAPLGPPVPPHQTQTIQVHAGSMAPRFQQAMAVLQEKFALDDRARRAIRAEVDDSKAQVESAEQRLREAEAELRSAYITAANARSLLSCKRQRLDVKNAELESMDAKLAAKYELLPMLCPCD